VGVVMPLCSLVPKDLKKKNIWRTVLGIHSLHVRGFPGFSGELGTTVILVSVSCTLLNHRSHYIYMQPSLFNKAVSCTLSKAGKRNS